MGSGPPALTFLLTIFAGWGNRHQLIVIEWTTGLQIGRNMTDAIDGALSGKRYLILDRDTKYSVAFRKVIGESGTAVIRLPLRSPNLNAFAERFLGARSKRNT